MTPELLALLAEVHRRIASRTLTIHSSLFDSDPHPWRWTCVWKRAYMHPTKGYRVAESGQRTAGGDTLEAALREVLATENRCDAGLREVLAEKGEPPCAD